MTDDANDDEIGRLFTVLPAEFVKARNAVAKALKAAGRRQEAAEVEKLPRPSVSVWAVNRLARQAPALVERLVAATERLQTGEHAGYAGAVADHRDALKALRLEAERLLEAAQLSASPEVLARVVHDLRAGILDAESRPVVQRGRLVRDVAEEDALSAFEQHLPPAPARHPPAEETPAKEAAAKEAARRARERRLEQLREAASAAEAASDRATAEVAAARDALADAERRLGLARVAAARAAAALEAATADDT